MQAIRILLLHKAGYTFNMPASRIYLVGMPGAGKSSLGQALAMRLGYAFADLDVLIEQAEGQKVTELFASKGETYFRQCEAAALAGTVQVSNTVIATGGGTPCFFENMAFMNREGLTIYLQIDPDGLLARLSPAEIQRRPLLQEGNARDKLYALLKARAKWYEQAQVHVPVQGSSLNDLTEALLKNKFLQ